MSWSEWRSFGGKTIFSASGMLSQNANVTIDSTKLNSIKITHTTDYECDAIVKSGDITIATVTPNANVTLDVSDYDSITITYSSSNSWVSITVETL